MTARRAFGLMMALCLFIVLTGAAVRDAYKRGYRDGYQRVQPLYPVTLTPAK